MTSQSFDLNWRYAYGGPLGSARLRANPEDFQVVEQLGYEPDGEGEHLWLEVVKREANTDWVADELAKAFNLPAGSVGYAGRKDRHAVTQQWFSLPWPLQQVLPDLTALAIEGVSVLRSARHIRKLRTGQLAGNRFRITLREVTAEHGVLSERLERIAEWGVPNYFGEQRFGHDGQNLDAALRLRDQRNQRKSRGRGRAPQRGGKQGIYLSAARSYLFNHLLSQRVADGTWREVLPGDVSPDPDQPTLQPPTGPMWGRGRLPTQEDTAAVEQRVLAAHQPFCDLLEHKGLMQERRSLVLRPSGFTWTVPEASVLELAFDLPAGTFATALIRELVAC